MPKPLSISIVVVTRKKINNKNAISAIEEVGISPPLNLRLVFTNYLIILVQVFHIGGAINPKILLNFPPFQVSTCLCVI